MQRMVETKLFVSLHELEQGYGEDRKRPRWSGRMLEALSQPSPETVVDEREECQKAEEVADQLMLQALELAWNSEEKQERPSFNQFCVMLLTMAGMKDADIAKALNKTLVNVRKTRHTATKKFAALVLKSGLGW
jgi:DNA-directed RNA polymerase specialized sigma24 family protein